MQQCCEPFLTMFWLVGWCGILLEDPVWTNYISCRVVIRSSWNSWNAVHSECAWQHHVVLFNHNYHIWGFPLTSCKGRYTYANHMQAKQLANSSHQGHGKLIFRKPEANTGHPVPPSAANSLCVHAKNWQISVCSDWYANHSQMSQHKFAVSSTHMHIWFMSSLLTVTISIKRILASTQTASMETVW